MSAQINYFEDRVDWEGCSIEKLTCSKDIPINNRIFALGRSALTPSSLDCRIWSFECFPKDCASLSWTIKNDKNEEMKAEAFKDGSFSLKVQEKEKKDELTCYLITGEDLQGEYWGSVFSVPLDTVLSFLGKKSLKADDRIYMEFRKEGAEPSVFSDLFRISC